MKLERLLGILIILLTKERVTANYLAEYFEVSKRTIYRDLDSLDLAGLPIATFSGRDGGIELFNDYKLDTHVFSDAEKGLLLKSLDSYGKYSDDKEVELLKLKIKDLSNDQMEEKLLKTVEVLRLSSLRDSVQKEVDERFKRIEKAIHSRKTVRFEYVNMSGEITVREVEPIQLQMNYGIWYLHGYCLLKADYRVFKMTRMNDLKMTDHTYTMKQLPNGNVHAVKEPETITITFAREKLGYLNDYFTQEEIIAVKESEVIVAFQFKHEFELMDLFFYFGSWIKDIEPCYYKKRFKERLVQVLDQLI